MVKTQYVMITFPAVSEHAKSQSAKNTANAYGTAHFPSAIHEQKRVLLINALCCNSWFNFAHSKATANACLSTEIQAEQHVPHRTITATQTQQEEHPHDTKLGAL